MGADDDGITALKVQKSQWRKRYIPYTNHAIHWHTDGYYNPIYQQIMALNLHCVRPAMEGGENALMDHEIAYLQLRDESPEYIEALMHPDAMKHSSCTIRACFLGEEERSVAYALYGTCA